MIKSVIFNTRSVLRQTETDADYPDMSEEDLHSLCKTDDSGSISGPNPNRMS